MSDELALRNEAIVTNENLATSNLFAEFAEQRDKWLATPFAHNTTLARGGYPFTIIDATIRDFEATELDTSRTNPNTDAPYKIGEPVEKIAYLCLSQMDWVHEPVGDVDVEYKKGEPFIIMFTTNTIRKRDFDRIYELLKGGPIYNIALQEYPNKVKGFNPAHGLVAYKQWKAIN